MTKIAPLLLIKAEMREMVYFYWQMLFFRATSRVGPCLYKQFFKNIIKVMDPCEVL